MTDVSIVIPVYNAERYLDRCLEHLKAQTMDSFEVILVDDGSTDQSLSICEKTAKSDPRFRVFHQENKGPAAARNTGLKVIKGRYVINVDADDVLHVDALEKMISEIEKSKADVCIAGWNRIQGDKVKPYIFSEEEMIPDPQRVIVEILHGDYRCGGGNPWNKLWRVESISRNNTITLFDESMLIYEDMLWTLMCLGRCSRVTFLQERIYDYYIYDTSVSRYGSKLDINRRFCVGAKRVYEYVLQNAPQATDAAARYYFNLLIGYLGGKIKTGNAVTGKDIEELKKLPVRPSMFRTYKQMIWYIIIRIFGIGKK